jgi:hypothetical protein
VQEQQLTATQHNELLASHHEAPLHHHSGQQAEHLQKPSTLSVQTAGDQEQKQSYVAVDGRMLTSQIKQADNWAMIDHLLDVYDPSVLNPIHAAAAFRQLLHLKRSQYNHQTAAGGHILPTTAGRGRAQCSRAPSSAQGAQGLMLRLCNIVLEHEGRLRPREVASILWGASGLGFVLPAKVLDVIMQVGGGAQPQQLSWPCTRTFVHSHIVSDMNIHGSYVMFLPFYACRL